MSELTDANAAAHLILLKQIASAAEGVEHPEALLRLAEAYAWVTSPGQPHGAASTAASK